MCTLRRYKHLSYKEISDKWQQSALSYGEGDELPLRTFHNHRKAIQDIFDIIIELDPDVKGYKYHILNPRELEGDGLRSWLVDSYATLNQIQADSRFQNRVEFEDIPSGHTWLTTFMQAMRENKVMEIKHQGFNKDYANTFRIEPYCLKVIKRRWYINPYYAEKNKRHKGEEGYYLARRYVFTDLTASLRRQFSIRPLKSRKDSRWKNTLRAVPGSFLAMSL